MSQIYYQDVLTYPAKHNDFFQERRKHQNANGAENGTNYMRREFIKLQHSIELGQIHTVEAVPAYGQRCQRQEERQKNKASNIAMVGVLQTI